MLIECFYTLPTQMFHLIWNLQTPQHLPKWCHIAIVWTWSWISLLSSLHCNFVGTPYWEFPIWSCAPTSPGRVELSGKLRMILASCGKKIWWIKSALHSPFSLLIKSETRASQPNNFGSDITLKVDGIGSHLSDQIRIFCPFPTHHLAPLLTICCAAIILRHK